MKTEPTNLPAADQSRLLALARGHARVHLGEGRDTPPPSGVRGNCGGIFVTLWNGAELRGCRGMFLAFQDLDEAVRRAVELALTDPRFATRPVDAAELASIRIEVSLLSQAAVVNDPLSLVPGVHGVIIRSGTRTGCFLPKVATDHGWDMQTFLANCCTMKAGLPAEAWRDQGVIVEAFTAEVFVEPASG